LGDWLVNTLDAAADRSATLEWIEILGARVGIRLDLTTEEARALLNILTETIGNHRQTQGAGRPTW
jgi:hypothetical protein